MSHSNQFEIEMPELPPDEPGFEGRNPHGTARECDEKFRAAMIRAGYRPASAAGDDGAHR